METIVRSGVVGGIEMHFIDLKTSGSVASEFIEFQRNDYGLEGIVLSPDDTVIDVGANVGMFSIYVRKKFGCKVIAFEPVPLNYENMKKNILLNGLSLDDIELHNIAITSQEGGLIQIGTPDYNTGGSSVYHTCSDIVSMCKTERLHKYISDKCAYLKIDCEGGEYDIIPDIIDYLNFFKYIGIECHKLRPEHDPFALCQLIKESFKGITFCNF